MRLQPVYDSFCESLKTSNQKNPPKVVRNVLSLFQAFLKMFQDRSEAGMAHKILANPRHRYNRGDEWDNMSTMSALEAQLLNMFQRDFLSLLGTFQ